MLAVFLLEGYFATLHEFEEDQMKFNKGVNCDSNRESIREVLFGDCCCISDLKLPSVGMGCLHVHLLNL